MLAQDGDEANKNINRRRGARNKEAIEKYLQEQSIEHHRIRIVRAHPNFSERAFRTLKICHIVVLRRIRKRAKTISSGQTIFLKFH